MVDLRSLRESVQAEDSANLEVIWKQLVSGRKRVAETYFSPSRCGVVLAAGVDVQVPASPLYGTRLCIVESVLRGIGQKQIAIELSLSPSTIATNARLGLEAIGVMGRPSRVHPLLMLAAMAARGEVEGVVSVAVLDGRVDVSIPRPDEFIAGSLPPAESEVIRGLVEGCCYQEIAKRRGTALRTTANQVAAVFKRMAVSGRAELMRSLLLQAESYRRDSPRGPSTVEPVRALAAAHA